MFRQSKILPSSIEGIDQKSKDLVFGFIKVCAFNAPFEALVPDSILHIVLVYFCVAPEEFDVCCKAEYMEIVDRLTIVNTSKIFTGSAYLTGVMNTGVHQWKFKIKHIQNRNVFQYIGVCKYNEDLYGLPITDNYFDSIYIKDSCYGFVVNKGFLINPQISCYQGKTYGRICDENDVIGMKLDLDSNSYSLSYSINDSEYSIAFEDIEKTTYKAAVSLFGYTTEMELVSYSCR
eukprot:98816_1